MQRTGTDAGRLPIRIRPAVDADAEAIHRGLLGIADIGHREAACGRCILTRSVEVSGGVFMATGILAVLGGFL